VLSLCAIMDAIMAMTGQQTGYRVPARGGPSVPRKRQWRSKEQQQQNPRYHRKKVKVQHGGEIVAPAGMYDPPRLRDLQHQNRIRTRKHFPKRRKSVPRAPFNNSSFLMRVRQSGGLASAVSPATPTTFLSTPVFSSSPALQYRESVVQEVKDLGVDGYGSMAGLIHLRSFDDDDEKPSTSGAGNECSSLMSDVEARQSLKEVDKRQLEQQDVVSRFEMTYPAANGVSNKTSQLMEVRLAEQESHIAYLEDENLTLKERLFLVQQEVNELRQRLQGGSCDGVVDEHEDACSDYGSSD